MHEVLRVISNLRDVISYITFNGPLARDVVVAVVPEETSNNVRIYYAIKCRPRLCLGLDIRKRFRRNVVTPSRTAIVKGRHLRRIVSTCIDFLHRVLRIIYYSKEQTHQPTVLSRDEENVSRVVVFSRMSREFSTVNTKFLIRSVSSSETAQIGFTFLERYISVFFK